MTGGDMMGGGMKGEDMMKGCDMMGGDMSHMRSMMREKLSHAGDRVAALKTELKNTEAQTPAWNKFADAFLVSAKSMEEAMDAMHHKMMQSGAAASLPEKRENGRRASCEAAGDQGRARPALCLVQRRAEKARGRAEYRPNGRGVTNVRGRTALRRACS